MSNKIEIKDKRKYTINTKNGVLDESNVEFYKNLMLLDLMRKHTSLIKVKQDYPKDNKSEVEFIADFIISKK
jgi:uncharacterized radical SAM superfamily protein